MALATRNLAVGAPNCNIKLTVLIQCVTLASFAIVWYNNTVMLSFTTLFSGSHGNSALIRSDNANILLDAGFTYTTLKKALKNYGLEPKDIDGIVITHEHSDHVSALQGWCSYNGKTPVYTHTNLYGVMLGKCKGNIVPFSDKFVVKDIEVDWVRCSHDSAFCCGYRFNDGKTMVGSVTDTGVADKSIVEFLQPCRTIMLESNHDVDMLNRGNYPYLLKRRILSTSGHLSNVDCATTLKQLLEYGNVRNIVLGHLSENNNTHELAFSEAVKAVASKKLTEGKDVNVVVAEQYVGGATIE